MPESRGEHPDFACLCGARFLVSMPVGLPFAHLAAFAEAEGMPHAEALSLLSLIGLGSIGGRFLLGTLADEVGWRTLLGCC